MNFFLADTHFGHKNAMSFDNRPFTDIEAHDNLLIENWNNAVGMDDDVYLLGDISWYNATKTLEIFRRLNGNIHLIKGNHDQKLLRNQDIQKLFVEVCDYKELFLNNKESIILSHYPIPCFKNHYYGWYHFYGHVHNGFEWNLMENVRRQMVDLYEFPCKMFNVGVMIPYMDYTPRTIDEIVLGYERTMK